METCLPPRGRGTRGGRRATAEIIFHVGRCEINNGQTRFNFPEVPAGPAVHRDRRGKAREQGLLAAAYAAASRRADEKGSVVNCRFDGGG